MVTKKVYSGLPGNEQRTKKKSRYTCLLQGYFVIANSLYSMLELSLSCFV